MTSKTGKIILAVAIALALQHGAAAAQSRTASARSYQARGDEFWAAGDYRRALEDYSLALVFDGQCAALWNKRGLARERNGDAAGALADFNRAIVLAPRGAAYLNNRGRAWLQQGELENALADLNRAVELDPTLAEAYTHRGLVRARKTGRRNRWPISTARSIANRNSSTPASIVGWRCCDWAVTPKPRAISRSSASRAASSRPRSRNCSNNSRE